MSESSESSVSHGAGPLEYARSNLMRPSASPLVRLGGGLGIAACAIGLAIFIASCAGLSMAVAFGPIPVLLALPGIVLVFLGANLQKHMISEDTHVLAALFTCVLGIIGGLLEMAVWLHWPLFAK